MGGRPQKEHRPQRPPRISKQVRSSMSRFLPSTVGTKRALINKLLRLQGSGRSCRRGSTWPRQKCSDERRKAEIRLNAWRRSLRFS